LKNILQWATSNGARLFGLEDKFGSFEIGRKPGFLVAEDFDIESKRLLGEGIQLF
jgi:cytosine/adenosine deaminase-related metal-dependent hydrolase